jgi:uncharacterized protein
MPGEKDLSTLLRFMQPVLNSGDYVFCTVADISAVDMDAVLFLFKETEAITVVTTRATADRLKLAYSFVAAWITLTIHSSLEAVGLTAAFSAALAREGISCNVVAAYFHDHIFVDVKDAGKAMQVLQQLAATA